MAHSTVLWWVHISIVSFAVARDRNIQFTKGSFMKWSDDIFWLEIFLAKFGAMFAKNSLNVLLICVPSEIIVPSVILNLFRIFFVLFLSLIFFIICHVFFKLSCLGPSGRNDIYFQHIVQYDSISFCRICEYLHYSQFSILRNLYTVYFFIASFSPCVNHDLR